MQNCGDDGGVKIINKLQVLRMKVCTESEMLLTRLFQITLHNRTSGLAGYS